MIHPKEGYVFGAKARKEECQFEGADVPCKVDVDGEQPAKRLAISRFCGCLWAVDNINYLQWKYEENR